MSLKISVLVPRSQSMPVIGKHFLDGIRSTLKPKLIASVSVDDYNAQNPGDSSLEKAQKIVLEKDPDLTFAFGDRGLLNSIQELFESSRKLLIYSDLGATLPKDLSGSGFTVHNSFDLWKSSFALGEYAAGQIKTIGIALDFYESGYHVHNLFIDALLSKGCRETFYYIQPHASKQPEWEKLRGLAADQTAEALFAAYSGAYAANFLSGFASISDLVPQLYLSSMFLMNEEASGAMKLEKPALAAATWFPGMKEKFNLDWTEKWIEKFEDGPSVYAMLGAEAGLWVNQAMESAGDTISPKKIMEAMKGLSFTGPRGTVKVSAESHRLEAQHRLVSLSAGISEPVRDEIEILPVSDPAPHLNTHLSIREMGWKNIYPTA